jgi:Flp pilus assembly protein TadG
MKGTSSTKTVRGETGQTLVEFAISSTAFFMILFGTIQLGLAVWNYNMLSSLAQDGARWAAVRGSACSCTEATMASVQDFVRGRVLGMLPSAVIVTTTWPDGDNRPGDTVRVQVDYTFSLFTAIVPIGSLPLHGIAQMEIAR